MDDGRAVILGVSCDFHDAAAAIVVDGSIVAAGEQERYSRVKHDASLPVDAIRDCLALAGLGAEEITHVTFYEKPLSVLSRYLTSRQASGWQGFRTFRRDVPDLVGRNLMIGLRLAATLRTLGAKDVPPVRFLEHHHSHAAAAFFPSPFERAAVLTIDGIGEWATASISHGIDARITPLSDMRYPNSLGLLYSFVTAWCGFEPNDGEYKLMGLAPYGEPRFRDALDLVAKIGDDGSIRLDPKAVSWFDISRASGSALADAWGGGPRDPGEEIEQRHLDLAASIQAFTEDAVIRLAQHALSLTNERRLCLAGGVALNCVANGRLLRDEIVDELWVQPAAGDNGSAIGAALSTWHEAMNRPRTVSRSDRMSGALLGTDIDQRAALEWLEHNEVPHTVATSTSALAAAVAAELAGGRIVGWAQGRMEFGPRALGNRSILADPRDPLVRERLNQLVKGRESFRPFAPIVLAEHASEWFDLVHESPYMLIVAPVLSEHLRSVSAEPFLLSERAAVPRSTIPACTHVDGSARIQTLPPSDRPIRALLEAFHALTECPMLVNTSFNVAGEPIVRTETDAFDCAIRAGLDVLVVGMLIIEVSGLTKANDLELVS